MARGVFAERLWNSYNACHVKYILIAWISFSNSPSKCCIIQSTSTRSTESHLTCLEPQLNGLQNQWDSCCMSKVAFVQFLMYDVITSLMNSICQRPILLEQSLFCAIICIYDIINPMSLYLFESFFNRKI